VVNLNWYGVVNLTGISTQYQFRERTAPLGGLTNLSNQLSRSP
jgi:hypothetical protein